MILKHIYTCEKTPQCNFGPKDLARELGYSKSTLYEYMKQKLGENSTQARFIHQIKMEEAKKLLMEDQLLVSDISFQLCYKSHSFFSQKFKEMHNGLSPLEWQRNYLKG